MANAKTTTSIRLFTLGEEIAHSITHGIGTALSIARLTVLVVLAVLYGNAYQTVSFSIYGATLVILYLASTLYHSFQQPRVKHLFKVIDHAAIFLLIAGTYTPFLLIVIQGTLGWVFLIIIWVLAILGIGLKTLFIGRFETISVLTYLLMGWLSVGVINQLVANLPADGIIWLVAGGMMYTVGVLFYALHRIPYAHAVWHMFVLGGSICHYVAVFLYLVPIS